MGFQAVKPKVLSVFSSIWPKRSTCCVQNAYTHQNFPVKSSNISSLFELKESPLGALLIQRPESVKAIAVVENTEIAFIQLSPAIRQRLARSVMKQVSRCSNSIY